MKLFSEITGSACRRLGMEYISAIIKPFAEEDSFLARVSENLLRNSYIDTIEEAEGYKMLVEKGWTLNAIAEGWQVRQLRMRTVRFTYQSLPARSLVGPPRQIDRKPCRNNLPNT